MDLTVLLAAQGDMVDQIAIQVNNAVDDTEEGVKELQQAVKLQKRNRKVYS
jgi:t-SNARE complex subunit (syntaxin)